MKSNLAGIIRSLVEFGVKKYDKGTNLLVFRQCFHSESSSIEQRRNCENSNKSC